MYTFDHNAYKWPSFEDWKRLSDSEKKAWCRILKAAISQSHPLIGHFIAEREKFSSRMYNVILHLM
jgi:hypothetical protein